MNAEEHARQELARIEKLAAEHKLSVSEVIYAERQGLNVEAYAALKNVRTVEQYEAARARLAASADAKAEAQKQLDVETERRRIAGGAS